MKGPIATCNRVFMAISGMAALVLVNALAPTWSQWNDATTVSGTIVMAEPEEDGSPVTPPDPEELDGDGDQTEADPTPAEAPPNTQSPAEDFGEATPAPSEGLVDEPAESQQESLEPPEEPARETPAPPEESLQEPSEPREESLEPSVEPDSVPTPPSDEPAEESVTSQ